MSAYRQLYADLAGMDCSFTAEDTSTISPTAYDLHQIKSNYEGMELPTRVLLPLEEYGGEGQVAGAYADTLLANTTLNSSMQLAGGGLSIRPGVYEFPLGSGRAYYGVACNLRFMELIG